MSILTDQWRQRANELNAQVEKLLDNPLANTATIVAMKAVLMPEILLALADMVDVQDKDSADGSGQINSLRQRNHLLRMAAARGDWDEVARIGGLNYDPGGATPRDADTERERETPPANGGLE